MCTYVADLLLNTIYHIIHSCPMYMCMYMYVYTCMYIIGAWANSANPI